MDTLAPRVLETNNHLVPSRSPSSTSASDAENENEESDSDLDLLGVEPAIHLNPALATPKATSQAFMSAWPYTSATQSSPAITIYTPIKIPASSLPHEILLSILKLLPSPSLSPALLVCKAWCQCGVELLWHKPAFTNLSSLFKMLLVISASQPMVEEDSELEGSPVISTNADEMDTNDSVEAGTTFPYPSFIRRLNFSSLSEEMSDKILYKLLPCIYLERLTLASCTALTSPALITMVGACERLVALDLSEVVGTEDGVLLQVAKSCPRLQGLNLSGCIKVTDIGVEAIARGCPGLRRVSSFAEGDDDD